MLALRYHVDEKRNECMFVFPVAHLVSNHTDDLSFVESSNQRIIQHYSLVTAETIKVCI